jgi:RNA ligase
MESIIRKYPRTKHLEGSRLQPGDEDMGGFPFSAIKGRHLVVEEKIDGANSGISFSSEGELLLQSRGHYLTGGAREKHFNLLKSWANAHQSALFDILEDRYIMYGEWLYAKHTVFYDMLPHYFLEFDILDTRTNEFLSTERRHEMLQGSPVISVPVLSEGPLHSIDALRAMIRPSLYKSPAWKARLEALYEEQKLSAERAWKETDAADFSEGLYLKVEEDGQVVERLKFVRASFLTAILESETHWLNRPIIPNQLRDGMQLYG